MTEKRYDEVLNEAYMRIKNGDMKPVEDILKIARKRYSPAEFLLGELNELNFGNLKEAEKWYMRAAKHGHAEAQKRYDKLVKVKLDT